MDKRHWLYTGGAAVALVAVYYLAPRSGTGTPGASATTSSTVVTPPYYIPTAAYPLNTAGTVPVFGSNGSVGEINAANYIAAYTANPGHAVPAMSPTVGLIPIIQNSGGISLSSSMLIHQKSGSGSVGFSAGGFGIGASASSTHLNQHVTSSSSSNFGQNVTWAPNAP